MRVYILTANLKPKKLPPPKKKKKLCLDPRPCVFEQLTINFSEGEKTIALVIFIENTSFTPRNKTTVEFTRYKLSDYILSVTIILYII